MTKLDYSQYSDAELVEMSEAIRAEFSHRREIKQQECEHPYKDIIHEMVERMGFSYLGCGVCHKELPEDHPAPVKPDPYEAILNDAELVQIRERKHARMDVLKAEHGLGNNNDRQAIDEYLRILNNDPEYSECTALELARVEAIHKAVIAELTGHES